MRNWADERYVRIYTTDTPNWLCLSFLAQGLFCLILRKVDRAGVIHLGRAGKRGVAIAIGHAHQWSMLEPALDELVADGCITLSADALVVPNFIEAQEARASDKARAKKLRESRRDLARSGAIIDIKATSQSVTATPENPNPRDGSVTKRDAAVTICDETVTPSHAVPIQPTTYKLLAVQPPEPPKPKTDPRFAVLKAIWCEEFQAATGAEYRWSAADARGVHRVIAEDPAEFRKRVKRSLTAIGFLKCGTVAKLTMGEVWNQLAAPASPGLDGKTRRTVAPISDWTDPTAATERL